MDALHKLRFTNYVKNYVPLFKTTKLKLLVNNHLLDVDKSPNDQSLSLFEANILKLSYIQKYSHELFNELPGDTTPKDVSKSILKLLYDIYRSSNDTSQNPMTKFLMNYGNANIGLLHLIYQERYKKLESQALSAEKIYLEKIFYSNQLFSYIKPEEKKYVLNSKELINPQSSVNFCYYAFKLSLANIIESDPDSLKNLKLKYILDKKLISQLRNTEINHLKAKSIYDREHDILESSNTHKSLCASLQRIKVNYEMEKQLHFYKCDIFLPLLKTALEYLGPCHFYPQQSQLRQYDKLRNEYLTEVLDIELRLIPWFIIAQLDTDKHVDGYMHNLVTRKIKDFDLNKEHFN